MKDELAQELTPPGKIRLGTQEYSLEFRMHAVILYKQETAKLDRSRAAERPRIPAAELAEMRRRRSTLLQDAQAAIPEKGKAWEPAAETRFNEALDEANRLKSAIDEQAGTGDSLLDRSTWWKIGPADPERLQLAVWVGAHRKNAQGKYEPALSLEDLDSLIHLGNAEDVTLQIAEVLRAYVPAKPLSTASAAGGDQNPATAESPAT